jgi:hypothetical protein
MAAAREQISPSPVLTRGDLEDCGYPSTFVPYLVDAGGSIYTYNTPVDTTSMYEQRRITMLRHSSFQQRFKSQRLSRNRRRRRNRTECNTGSSPWRALLALLLQDMPPLHVALVQRCPSRLSSRVRNWLDSFPGRWIGHGGPIAWSPRSPDPITPPL